MPRMMRPQNAPCSGLRRFNSATPNPLKSFCGGSLRRFVRRSAAVRVSHCFWLCGGPAVVACVCPPYPPTPPRAFWLGALVSARAVFEGELRGQNPAPALNGVVPRARKSARLGASVHGAPAVHRCPGVKAMIEARDGGVPCASVSFGSSTRLVRLRWPIRPRFAMTITDTDNLSGDKSS